MSEEVEHAAVNIPRAIVTTMLLNGATGFAMVVAIMFCLGDPETALVIKVPDLTAVFKGLTSLLQESKTGFAFEQVFYNGLNSKAGATVLICIPFVLLWCAVIGFLATASRMTWSFARDRGVPFHRLISRVSSGLAFLTRRLTDTAY